ncbi:MAG: CARDB domain-containing protein, partial [Candidatus Hodarchaeales archaeon]
MQKELIICISCFFLLTLTGSFIVSAESNDKNETQRENPIEAGLIAQSTVSQNSRSALNAVGPDLVISNLRIPTTTVVSEATPATAVTITIMNQGDTTVSTSFKVTFDENTTKDGLPFNPGGFILVSTSLAPGATVNEQFFVGQDSTTWPVGSYSLIMKADSENVITESNETNNLSPELTFDIVSDEPDLVITNFTIPTTTVVSGATPATSVNIT